MVETKRVCAGKSDFENLFAAQLGLRNLSYTPNSKLVEDLGMDSHDLVGLVMEFEALLGREIGDDAILLFISSTVGEICARLAEISDVPIATHRGPP